MAVQFVDITRSEFLRTYRKLYRFIPIERLLEILETKKVGFRNPEKWEDPFERLYITAKYRKDGIEISWPLRKKIFCLCCTKTATSEAFWKGYTPLNDGVRVQIDTKKFVEELDQIDGASFFAGKVNYKLTDEISELKENRKYIQQQFLKNNVSKNFELLLLKRKSFEYENEVRFAAIMHVESEEDNYFTDINPQKIFTEYLLHPRMGVLHADILRSSLKEDYNAKKVGHSKLYTPKDLKINV